MKRLLTLLLCVMTALGCFSFAQAEEEKTHLSLWIPMDMRIVDYKTNWMTKWLEENGNFDLEFILQPSGNDYTTKVNMALTAGKISDLPDIIIGASSFSDANVQVWAENGYIVPLTKYYNDPELSRNIREAYDRAGFDFTGQITSPNGEIYGFAFLNQSYYNEHTAKMWIYTPWLEKLNLQMPTTPDELYEVLKAVVNGDPNGNGKADEMGLCGTFGSAVNYDNWFEYVMNAYVYAGDEQYRTVNDGVVGLAYTTEEWKEGLKFLNKLYNERLLEPESLTMNKAVCDSLYNTEDVTAFTISYAAPDPVNNIEVQSGYDHMLPLVGPKGLQVASYRPSVAGIQMVVTANCKDVEGAFRLGDLMSNELIGISQRFGAQGIDWDYARDVKGADAYTTQVPGWEMSIVTYHDGEFWGGSQAGNSSWRQKGPMVRQYAIANGLAFDPEAIDVPAQKLAKAAVAYQTGGFNPAEVIPKIILTEEEIDQVTEIESNLLSYVREMSAAFIAGTADIDAKWDSFQSELKAIGSETYVEVMQNAYDRMYKNKSLPSQKP